MPSIPQDYHSFIAREIGPLAEGLVDCLEQTAPEVAVRLNRRKLRAYGMPDGWLPAVCRGGERVPWWPDGYLLPERPDFTHDPALHQGLYYVQDASSMITAHVVEALAARLGGAPLLMLDACAAPGGKSTAAIDALPEGSMLVANEFDFRRASILAENIQKWGYPAVAVSRGDTARFRRLPELFDIVAADVPCSGEGMMRKDEQAVAQWSERLVDECADRQWEIVENLWETLAPGGYFVYSTCTFNTRENERITDRIIADLGAEPVAIPLPGGPLSDRSSIQAENSGKEEDNCGIVVDSLGRMRFLPTRVRGEGLFMAILRKPGSWTPALTRLASTSPRKGKKKVRNSGSPAELQLGGKTSKPLDLAALCTPWLQGDFEFSLRGDTVYARPQKFEAVYALLDRHLDLLLPGLEIATLKGRTLLPTQPLALTTALNLPLPSSCSTVESLPSAPEVSCSSVESLPFPTAEVGLDLALSYLRRESLPGFPDSPRGPLLLTHSLPGSRPLPLGFVNNLGNRANNLYPAPWRILH